MTDSKMNPRPKTNLLLKHADFIVLALIAILAAFLILIDLSQYHETTESWLRGIVPNASSELISIIITVGILDWLQRRRDRQEREAEQRLAEQNALKQMRRNLIRKMRSRNPDNARDAVLELRDRGWLTDGTLQGVDLRGAALSHLDLKDAQLQGANLQRANLSEASLIGADLSGAKLQYADLYKARLQNADLRGANLQEARLFAARTAGVQLDESWLPDGTKYANTTDLARFIRPDHARFWTSNDLDSPAHPERRTSV